MALSSVQDSHLEAVVGVSFEILEDVAECFLVVSSAAGEVPLVAAVAEAHIDGADQSAGLQQANLEVVEFSSGWVGRQPGQPHGVGGDQLDLDLVRLGGKRTRASGLGLQVNIESVHIYI